MSCPERQEILERFRSAFDDYSLAVREQRAANPPNEQLEKRSAEAQTDCERLWAELQQHQSTHKCWP